MRGNESVAPKESRVELLLFSIPMRGNEFNVADWHNVIAPRFRSP